MSQLPGSLIALCWAIFAYRLDASFFIWSLPVVIPLILAVPVSMLLGRVRMGRVLRNFGLLCVPEEVRGCPLVDDLQPPAAEIGRTMGLTAFEAAVVDPGLNRLHQSLGRRHRGQASHALLYKLRLRCLQEGPGTLTAKERSMLAGDRESLDWLHRAAWQADSKNYWATFHVAGMK